MGDKPDTSAGRSAMDYHEHERTWAAFVRISVLITLCSAVVLVGLAIGATGRSWGLGSAFIVLGVLATALGLFVKSLDYKPVSGVLGLAFVTWMLTAA